MFLNSSLMWLFVIYHEDKKYLVIQQFNIYIRYLSVKFALTFHI